MTSQAIMAGLRYFTFTDLGFHPVVSWPFM